MSRYQLEIAIVLEASAALSAACIYLNRTKEGKIQLLVHVDGSDEIYPDGDPFDVTTAQDLVEGYPLEEEEFWERMRSRKIFLSLLLFFSVPVQAASLVLGEDTAVFSLNFCCSLYLFGLSVSSIYRQTMYRHSESVWHLTALAILASLLMGFTAILPTKNLPATAIIHHSALPWLWYTSLVIYVLAAVTAMTTPRGPPLRYPPEAIYSEKIAQAITNKDENNVSGVNGASPLSFLYFEYSTKVAMLGNTAESLDIGDLPILTVNMRATFNYIVMKRLLRDLKLSIGSWRPTVGSGATLAYQIFHANHFGLMTLAALSVVAGGLFYVPPFFMSRVLAYLENDPLREHTEWGFVWVVGLFSSNVLLAIVTGQLWSLTTTTLQSNIRTQLNSTIFAKTLVRKDVASSAASTTATPDASIPGTPGQEEKPKEEDEFSSKAQVMTLMTTDVDRVGRFCHQLFTLIDAPIELCIGTVFLYSLLGVSCFIGLGVSVLCMPLNHFAGKIVKGAQTNLMKSRDERVALMNEVLGGIRMLKFMAWERSFEAKIMKIRATELKYQRLTFTIATLLEGLWNMTPILVTLVSFYHFAVVRGEKLTPSIAFTSILVFNELKFALGALPELFVNMVQTVVSLQRIEKYLQMPEVNPVLAMRRQSQNIAFQSCTVTWPQQRSLPTSESPSAASTPRHKFVLIDLSLQFPPGELSLICGKLGSGKTLLLLALLGEADVLSGGIMCPRSPADSLASFAGIHATKEDWVIPGICAYVPQAAWLQNASIKDNILFNLPYDEKRYQLTLEVCALVSDLAILEDGDESEIGERGVNLSGGQKARVSLARAVYSRASILLLDDVLSAVDAHTAHQLYHSCIRGELMQGRTVILVSHHVQLCAPGAAYVVALDNGRVQFQGGHDEFQSSGVMRGLMQSTTAESQDADEEAAIEHHPSKDAVPETIVDKAEKKQPRKFSEDEQRMVGRVAWSVWRAYIIGTGTAWYWSLFALVFILAALGPLFENGWLSYWSRGDDSNSPFFFLSIYAVVSIMGLIFSTVRYFVLYQGAIHASTVLYKELLQAVLFAKIRLHDTISRGRLLNRFGKDFEVIDSSLPGNFGRSVVYLIATITTVVTISFVGGPPFVFIAFLISMAYYQVAKIYGRACRDMRRLESVTRSPLYSMYSETIAGVTIVRAFGASSKFLRDMLRHVDTNTNPGYWNWGINRWFSIRMICLASIATSLLALLAVVNKEISAPLAGFALAFSGTITYDLLLLIREFVSLEQAMVGLERVKEYTELAQEGAEFIEPRPAPSWPEHGAIRCEDLVIRYAPELPDVLHKLSFDVKPGEKVGILGRTGSGKSTLALSFFRFVDPAEGRIIVDGLDIAQIGLSDLRSRLTIIPQDPTILSGTLRTTLDVFNEYQDAELFEALRRVHLIPSEHTPEEVEGTVNANLFRNLESPVSEGGDNFSTGERQLLCMARAILKRSKILVMDEATASVDYNTDELIGKTIRHEFKDSTILTIAHRLRTVIDYDRIMLLDQGEIAEFDRPAVLMANKSSKFHALCKATGREEFAMLQKMAGV
ncbi:multidrug resistance-associated ABC transporter [Mycena alexandri]|uniref:Multidrug resistance-associated ABC transporter n=1 Tax=Mycena alexandri TaxID=1745969 RepID=A0AAD6WY79_9AGAR|nr:multidrug resistance-associated ABC transporter [Mycena alexandri]